MLKHRLISGTLMTLFFTGLVILDAWIDGSLSASMSNRPIQGTLTCVLVAFVIVLAQREFSKLASRKNLIVFTPVSMTIAILLATSWYWPQLVPIAPSVYICSILAFAIALLLIYQYVYNGTTGTLTNCGINLFSIIYLGILAAFVPVIRIDFGPWPFLMVVFVVKIADIGAYTAGNLWGLHKFSPKISPGKTWEGLAGAIVAAVVLSVIFAAVCDIMAWWLAIIFGFCFAIIGQLSDLAESMIKRDVDQKDSANRVPGFGGILDVVDSVLLSSVFAYLFFVFFID